MENKFKIPTINKNSALPSATQLARQLTWLIADGAIAAGEKLPSIRDYSQHLNIHHHTVRAAYHQLEARHLVRMQPGVGTIVQEYVPFLSAPRQEFLDEEMIAILVPGLSEFYQEIILGIEEVAMGDRLIPVVLNCHEDPLYAETIFNVLSARNIRGIINISIGFSDEFFQKFLQKEYVNIPLVYLDVVDAGTHSITIDTPGSIELATAHLLDHGYADLVLLNCPAEWPIGREAIKGFKKAITQRGLEFQQKSVYSVPDFGYHAGRFVIQRMLQENELPRAIVAVSDNLAIGAISALKENEFRIPQDVAIIGFNDILPASFIDPPLTTIALPLYEMGKQTMLSLKEVLVGNLDHWIHKKYSGHLKIRRSCGCDF